MKISDLSSLQRGLVKVTQSLKKMKETFKLMHSKFELTEQSQLNQLTCCVCDEGRDIQGYYNKWNCALFRSCGSNCVSWNIENFCLRVSLRSVTICCMLKLFMFLTFISSGADKMMKFPSASTFLLYFSLLLHYMFN